MIIQKTVAEVGLRYKSEVPVSTLPVINSPEAAYKLLCEIWDQDTLQLKEEFIILVLNNDKRCLGWSKVSSGGSNSTIVEPSFVFQTALLANAQSILVAHNHPSGRLKESVSDVALTRRLVKAGKLFGIPVSDHIILTADGYLSFVDKGLL